MKEYINPLTDIDILNLLGLLAQFIGFIILAKDMWPEYKKIKRKQMILWMVGISREVEKRIEAKEKRNLFYFYATYKDAFIEAYSEIQKHEPKAKLNHYDDFIKEEEFHKFFSVINQNYEKWISDISSIETFRTMYLGRAVIIIIFGYFLQISAVIYNTTFFQAIKSIL